MKPVPSLNAEEASGEEGEAVPAGILIGGPVVSAAGDKTGHDSLFENFKVFFLRTLHASPSG